MAKLHLGNGNWLYYESGKAVTINGYPVKRWDSDNKRWSISTGSEVKDFKGKTILDLEKILWFVLPGFSKNPAFAWIFCFIYKFMIKYIKYN